MRMINGVTMKCGSFDSPVSLPRLKVSSREDDDLEEDLWDFGTVRTTARQQTIGRGTRSTAVTLGMQGISLDEDGCPPKPYPKDNSPVTSISANRPAPPLDTPKQGKPIAVLSSPEFKAGPPYQSGSMVRRARQAATSSISSGSSALQSIPSEEIVIKGEVPSIPNAKVRITDKPADSPQGTLRGGPHPWEDDDEDLAVDESQIDDLADRTMLDSVILPIIASVRHSFGSSDLEQYNAKPISLKDHICDPLA